MLEPVERRASQTHVPFSAKHMSGTRRVAKRREVRRVQEDKTTGVFAAQCMIIEAIIDIGS